MVACRLSQGVHDKLGKLLSKGLRAAAAFAMALADIKR
jgi:hypothetical protein